ncbi:unnamed protein product [Caenorhabditis brenneri]
MVEVNNDERTKGWPAAQEVTQSIAILEESGHTASSVGPFHSSSAIALNTPMDRSNMKNTRVVIPRHEQAAVLAAISRERIESNEPKDPNVGEPSTTRREPKNRASTGLVSALPRDCPSTSGPVSGHPTRFQHQSIVPLQTNVSSLSIDTDANKVTPATNVQVPQSSSGSLAATLPAVLNNSPAPSATAPAPFDFLGSRKTSFDVKQAWRICVMKNRITWVVEPRACTKTYAAWRNTQVTLSPEDFARMMSHQEAVRKLNVLRKNNELSGKLTLDFNSAYVECPLGQRFRLEHGVFDALDTIRTLINIPF